MDIQLARTFLAVVQTGSFQLAADALFVTQSAVSLRVKRLEEELGQTLFTRTKAGAVMTPAGEQFERFGRTLVRVLEEARHQVAVPEGFESTLIVGAHYALWPGLGLRWLRLMERLMPTTAFRAEIGQSDRIMRLLVDGLCDIAIAYTPQLRPGLNVEPIFEDQLVLVAADDDVRGVDDPRYVLMDWSDEFVTAHKTRFPAIASPRVTLTIGLAALPYLIDNHRAAYFPARLVEEDVAAGRLHLVPDAPAFPFPAYVVWSGDESRRDELAEAVRLLRAVAEKVDDDQTEVLEEAGVDEFDTSLTTQVGLFEDAD